MLFYLPKEIRMGMDKGMPAYGSNVTDGKPEIHMAQGGMIL